MQKNVKYNYMKYKTSKKPIVLILSIIMTTLILLLVMAIFVLTTIGALPKSWWIFIIITYLSSNMVITQIILSSEFNKHSVITWLIIIYFIPLVGGLIYIIFGKIPITRYYKLKKVKKERSELLNKNSKIKSKKLDLIDEIIKRKNYNNTSIEIVSSAKKFHELFSALEKAASYIHMEYYIFRQGEIFYDLYEILSRKVKEGVEVRIIIDDAGSLTVKSAEIKKWKKAGMNISKFNKIKPPFFSGYINFRMHRKIIIIDGEQGFLGGVNIGDEYIGLSSKYGDWLDLHIVIKGEAIQEMSNSFLLDWKFSTGEDLLNKKKYLQINKKIKNNSIIKIVEDGSDVDNSTFEKIFSKLTINATKKVWIATPYTIIPRKISKMIITAARSGVDVKIFVPGKADRRLVSKAGQFYLSKLNDNKIEVYKTSNLFLHTKAIIWDDDISMIGTSNLDFRSLYLNFEINAFIDSNKTNKSLENYFNQLMIISDKKKPKYKSHYPWNWINHLFYWLITPFL